MEAHQADREGGETGADGADDARPGHGGHHGHRPLELRRGARGPGAQPLASRNYSSSTSQSCLGLLWPRAASGVPCPAHSPLSAQARVQHVHVSRHSSPCLRREPPPRVLFYLQLYSSCAPTPTAARTSCARTPAQLLTRSNRPSASERRGNNLKRFKDVCPKANARLWH